MTRTDWTLLAIAAAGGPPLTGDQLQSALFLLEQNYPEAIGENRYNFEAWHYGPFAEAVHDDAVLLESQELVIISRASEGWLLYAPTLEGCRRARKLCRDRAQAEAVSYLRKSVGWTLSVSFQQLVTEIADRYPTYQDGAAL
jgi:hypothetical protein